MNRRNLLEALNQIEHGIRLARAAIGQNPTAEIDEADLSKFADEIVRSLAGPGRDECWDREVEKLHARLTDLQNNRRCKPVDIGEATREGLPQCPKCDALPTARCISLHKGAGTTHLGWNTVHGQRYDLFLQLKIHNRLVELYSLGRRTEEVPF